MKILVIDDHEFTREGISRILTQAFEVTKMAQAFSYETAMKEFRKAKFDLIIVDITLKGRSGLEIIADMRLTDKKVPILVLSMVPVSQYIRRVLQAGATGYLTKDESAEELLRAVRLLISRQHYFSPEVQQELPGLIDEATERTVFEDLTDRELDILRELAQGKTNKQIADEFQITANTVNSYRKRIMFKLHAQSNLDIIRYALKNGFVQ
jgi:DNA-binding NarL/FixJ family response regulator